MRDYCRDSTPRGLKGPRKIHSNSLRFSFVLPLTGFVLPSSRYSKCEYMHSARVQRVGNSKCGVRTRSKNVVKESWNSDVTRGSLKAFPLFSRLVSLHLRLYWQARSHIRVIFVHLSASLFVDPTTRRDVAFQHRICEYIYDFVWATLSFRSALTSTFHLHIHNERCLEQTTVGRNRGNSCSFPGRFCFDLIWIRNFLDGSPLTSCADLAWNRSELIEYKIAH